MITFMGDQDKKDNSFIDSFSRPFIVMFHKRTSRRCQLTHIETNQQKHIRCPVVFDGNVLYVCGLLHSLRYANAKKMYDLHNLVGQDICRRVVMEFVPKNMFCFPRGFLFSQSVSLPHALNTVTGVGQLVGWLLPPLTFSQPSPPSLLPSLSISLWVTYIGISSGVVENWQGEGIHP